MKNFIWVIFAHFFGDIVFQSIWQSQNKGKIPYVMFCHCMIWTATISVALQYLGVFALWKVPFLFCGHYIMDSYKCSKLHEIKIGKLMYIDQVVHITQCLIVYVL